MHSIWGVDHGVVVSKAEKSRRNAAIAGGVGGAAALAGGIPSAITASTQAKKGKKFRAGFNSGTRSHATALGGAIAGGALAGGALALATRGKSTRALKAHKVRMNLREDNLTSRVAANPPQNFAEFRRGFKTEFGSTARDTIKTAPAATWVKAGGGVTGAAAGGAYGSAKSHDSSKRKGWMKD